MPNQQTWETTGTLKITVPSEKHKAELLAVSQYLHDLHEIDTDIPFVNTLTHLYVAPHLVVVDPDVQSRYHNVVLTTLEKPALDDYFNRYPEALTKTYFGEHTPTFHDCDTVKERQRRAMTVIPEAVCCGVRSLHFDGDQLVGDLVFIGASKRELERLFEAKEIRIGARAITANIEGEDEKIYDIIAFDVVQCNLNREDICHD